MTTIGPAAADFAARLRLHLANGAKAAPSAAARQGTGTRGTGGGATAALPPEVALAERIAALDPADPRRRERTFALFIESLLLAEFGRGLAADPGLAAMVDRVAAQMLADEQLARLVDDTVDRLLAARG
jgi:hypothetical protein